MKKAAMYDKIYVLKKASKNLSLQLEARGPPQSTDRRVMYRCDEETCHGVRTLLTKAVLVEGAYNVPWVIDGDCPRCLLCRAAFSTFRRRHHCRACGRLICHECLANKRIKVVSLQRDEHASIVCVSCYDSLRVAPQPPPPKKGITTAVKAPPLGEKASPTAQFIPTGGGVNQQQQPQQDGVTSTPATSHTVTSPSIVWDASSDGVSTPGSTTSPHPAPCFWENSAQNTPEESVSSEKYFYTPVPSTPAPSRSVTTSRALAAASATGVWKGDGGSDDASNLLQPLPGFSIKCSRVEREGEGEKVYINVCHHSGLAEYNRQGELELGREVSILVGPSHQAIDESGALFSGWDVVCASQHVTRAFEDGEGEVLRALCEAVIDKVGRTHGVSFSKEFKLARTGAGYIGGKPSKMSVL